jgi:hypothetical protein
MNLGFVESFIGLERVATGDEVRCAMSCASQGALEVVGRSDDLSEMDSYGGPGCRRNEDIGWLMIAREIRDFSSN